MDDWLKMKSVADIFSNSTYFLDSYENIFNITKNENLKELIASVIIPKIVLKAFSCEMYLKAYLSYNGIIVPKTHDLYVLFINLEVSFRNKLTKNYY
jgi:hypothetical protein